MDLLAPVASKFSSIIETIVASIKIDFPLRTLLEAVYGPIAAIEKNARFEGAGVTFSTPACI